MKIYPPNKIYISKSPVHGYGVFANQVIEVGEIIEEITYKQGEIYKINGFKVEPATKE